MRGRQDEAFANVIEAVMLGVIGKAERELELREMKEGSDRGLVFGLVETSRQGAADGRVFQQF